MAILMYVVNCLVGDVHNELSHAQGCATAGHINRLETLAGILSQQVLAAPQRFPRLPDAGASTMASFL